MSNFSFLKEEFLQLYYEAAIAEKYTFTASKYAALQCRITLELGVNWLYDNDVDLERPYDTTLSALLHHYLEVCKHPYNRTSNC